MKRSAFKPGGASLKRSPMKPGTKRMPARRVGGPRRESTYRNPALLAAVRELPCANCGMHHKTQAAHSNQLRFGKGRSKRASDAAIMALCSNPAIGVPGCHELHDHGGKRDKQEAWAFEYLMISRTLLTLVARGRIKCVAGAGINLPSIQTDPEALCVALIGHIEAGRLAIQSP